MQSICFATNNQNKLNEIQSILENRFVVKSLKEIGCEVELPETQATLEGNSKQKAQYVLENFGIDCFADDTGLEVAALNGEPGVYSARYAGAQRNNIDNMNLLMAKLVGSNNRKARFRTVITYSTKEGDIQFEGIVNGEITEVPKGDLGFGYDPIFIPEGHTKTFAEMNKEEKNLISHRGIAVNKLIDYLLAKKVY